MLITRRDGTGTHARGTIFRDSDPNAAERKKGTWWGTFTPEGPPPFDSWFFVSVPEGGNVVSDEPPEEEENCPPARWWQKKSGSLV